MIAFWWESKNFSNYFFSCKSVFLHLYLLKWRKIWHMWWLSVTVCILMQIQMLIKYLFYLFKYRLSIILCVIKITLEDCAALQGYERFFVNRWHFLYICTKRCSYKCSTHPHTHTLQLCVHFPLTPGSVLQVVGAWLWLSIGPTPLQQQLAGAGHTAPLIATAQGPSALRHRSGGNRRRRGV